MKYIGFQDFDCRQTIFKQLAKTTDSEPVQTGYGKGSFIAICGTKR